jgi:hypothetical protein
MDNENDSEMFLLHFALDVLEIGKLHHSICNHVDDFGWYYVEKDLCGNEDQVTQSRRLLRRHPLVHVAREWTAVIPFPALAQTGKHGAQRRVICNIVGAVASDKLVSGSSHRLKVEGFQVRRILLAQEIDEVCNDGIHRLASWQHGPHFSKRIVEHQLQLWTDLRCCTSVW